MLITFEGIDGCGKSSIILGVVKLLKKHNYKVITTREPGGTKISEKIRSVILNNDNMDYITECLLYAASRRQHVVEKIIPALKKNNIVICDRYIDSSLAYQGIGRNIGIEQVLKINSINNEILWPSITFLLDTNTDIAFKRMKKRKNNKKNDKFDNAPISFHNKIQKAFLKIAKKYKNRIVIINANQDKQKIIQEIFDKIKTFINKTHETRK